MTGRKICPESENVAELASLSAPILATPEPAARTGGGLSEFDSMVRRPMNASSSLTLTRL